LEVNVNRLIVSTLWLAAASPAFAGQVSVFARIPTLDDAGLAALTLVVAVAGGIAARRKKKK
jgi:IPTL-CTERM motif